MVTTGIYGYVRNPMYLGSFFIGGGFVLLLWPWWTFPIFVFCFYQRFKQQVLKEEAHLKKIFGKSYEVYCQNVPAIQPTRDKIRSVTIQDVFFLGRNMVHKREVVVNRASALCDFFRTSTRKKYFQSNGIVFFSLFLSWRAIHLFHDMLLLIFKG